MVNTGERAVETVSTSRADDNAFHALVDATELTADMPDARIVGGQMVSILTLAYPRAPRIDRRTADADVGISTEIAAGAILHTRLVASGYVPTTGNHYERGDAEIDVLAPSLDGRFRSAIIGERGFDLTPGLGLALSGSPVVVSLGVTFLDGSRRTAAVRVPRVEVALVLKALATRSRTVAKDYTDIYNLLQIANAYPAGELGGWTLRQPGLHGAKLDGARALHHVADQAMRISAIEDGDVPREQVVALIRELIARPPS